MACSDRPCHHPAGLDSAFGRRRSPGSQARSLQARRRLYLIGSGSHCAAARLSAPRNAPAEHDAFDRLAVGARVGAHAGTASVKVPAPAQAGARGMLAAVPVITAAGGLVAVDVGNSWQGSGWPDLSAPRVSITPPRSGPWRRN